MSSWMFLMLFGYSGTLCPFNAATHFSALSIHVTLLFPLRQGRNEYSMSEAKVYKVLGTHRKGVMKKETEVNVIACHGVQTSLNLKSAQGNVCKHIWNASVLLLLCVFAAVAWINHSITCFWLGVSFSRVMNWKGVDELYIILGSWETGKVT